MQTVLAECLEMQRGISKKLTGKEHSERNDFPMDVLLPSITRYSGKGMIPLAIFHGILIDMSVPVFVSFFCNL